MLEEEGGEGEQVSKVVTKKEQDMCGFEQSYDWYIHEYLASSHMLSIENQCRLSTFSMKINIALLFAMPSRVE